MNKAGVVIALLVTALLGVAAWWLTRPGGTGRPAGPVAIAAGVDPALARTIKIGWVEGGDATISKVGAGDVWMMAESGPAGFSWPVEAETARAALRLLCAAEGEETPAPPAAPSGPRVQVEFEGGARLVVHFSDGSLAGRCVVGVEVAGGPPRSYLVADSLARLFEERAIGAWRSRRALPIEATVSRVQLEGAGERVSLSRAGGSWGLIEPGLGRADERAVAELLSKLGGIEVERFERSGGAGPDTGLSVDAASVTVESDRRVIAGDSLDRRTLTQHVRIGARADIAGRSVFVELSGRESDPASGRDVLAWGPVVAVVESSRLSGIATDPVAYVDRRACPSPPADIAGLTFRSAGDSAVTVTAVDRSVEGWTWTTDGGPAAPVPLEDVRPLEAMLRLVCEERAAGVFRATAEPSGIEVQLARRGEPAVSLVVTAAPAAVGEAAWLEITADGITRRYPLEAWSGVRQWIEDRVRPRR